MICIQYMNDEPVFKFCAWGARSVNIGWLSLFKNNSRFITVALDPLCIIIDTINSRRQANLSGCWTTLNNTFLGVLINFRKDIHKNKRDSLRVHRFKWS